MRKTAVAAFALTAAFGLAACGSSSPTPTSASSGAPVSGAPSPTGSAVPTIHVGQSGSFIEVNSAIGGAAGSNHVTWTLNNVATAPSAKLADGTVAYPGPNPAGAGAAGSSPNPAYQWVVIDVTIMNNGPVRPVDPVAGAQPVSPAQVSFQWVATPGNKVSSFTYADLPADNRVANALGVNTHTCLTGSSARLTPGQQASGEYTFSAPAGSGNLAITTTRGQPVAMLAIK